MTEGSTFEIFGTTFKVIEIDAVEKGTILIAQVKKDKEGKEYIDKDTAIKVINVIK